jgi:hypothetical protein
MVRHKAAHFHVILQLKQSQVVMTFDGALIGPSVTGNVVMRRREA